MAKRAARQGGSEVSFVHWGFNGGAHVPRVMPRPHLHQEIEFNFLPTGSMTYLLGGELITVPARRFTVFWAAVPHQLMRVAAGPQFYWFTIPFAWVMQWQLPAGFTESLLQGRFFIDGEEREGDSTLCSRWDHDMRQKNPESQRIALLEMEARLRRFIQGNPRALRSRARRVAGGESAVQKIAEIIARHYAEPLSIAEIVKPTGLHPNYAMTHFRATCGMSILDYLIQHRIFHARRLLATTDAKIIEIAFASGFRSLSRFNEAFARANKCTPRQYRKRLQQRASALL